MSKLNPNHPPTFNTGVLVHHARNLSVDVVPVEATGDVLLRLGEHPNCITLADAPEGLRSLLSKALEAVADAIAAEEDDGDFDYRFTNIEDEGPDLVSHTVDLTEEV